MSGRNPYVGPNGQASPDVAPIPTWTPEQLAQAETELRDVLQRQYDMAVAMATETPHGMPEGTAGKYAARAYLLRELLDRADSRVWPRFRCGVCGCTVPQDHESGGEVCHDLRHERQAKRERD